MMFPMAKEFLESSFNGLMSAVTAEINNPRTIVNDQDHVKFLWIVRFFFKFFLALPTQVPFYCVHCMFVDMMLMHLYAHVCMC